MFFGQTRHRLGERPRHGAHRDGKARPTSLPCQTLPTSPSPRSRSRDHGRPSAVARLLLAAAGSRAGNLRRSVSLVWLCSAQSAESPPLTTSASCSNRRRARLAPRSRAASLAPIYRGTSVLQVGAPLVGTTGEAVAFRSRRLPRFTSSAVRGRDSHMTRSSRRSKTRSRVSGAVSLRRSTVHGRGVASMVIEIFLIEDFEEICSRAMGAYLGGSGATSTMRPGRQAVVAAVTLRRRYPVLKSLKRWT